MPKYAWERFKAPRDEACVFDVYRLLHFLNDSAEGELYSIEEERTPAGNSGYLILSHTAPTDRPQVVATAEIARETRRNTVHERLEFHTWAPLLVGSRILPNSVIWLEGYKNCRDASLESRVDTYSGMKAVLPTQAFAAEGIDCSRVQ